MSDSTSTESDRDWTAQELLDGLREYAADDRDGFSRRVLNPVTEKYQKLEDLSEDGYCRRFLELLLLTKNPDVVDLGHSPVLTFDKDRWQLHEHDGQHVLIKRDAETRFDEHLLETSATDTTTTDHPDDNSHERPDTE